MTDRSFRTIGLVGVGLLCGLVAVRTIAGPTNSAVRETVLAKIPATAGGGKPLVSSDNRQVAFPVMHRGKWCVSLNGVESELYTKVSELTFSPNGKRLAFAGRRELSRNLVVLDGKEGAEYEYLPHSLTFSPDSRRLAFGTGTSNAWFAVLNGKQGPDFESCASGGPGRPTFFFSPDGRKLAYVGMKKSAPAKLNSEVVIEAEKREVFPAGDNAIIDGFSPDSQHLAWSVQRSNQWQVIVDGKADPLFDQIGEGSFRFSSNSQHRAYFAEQGGRWMAVFDGKAGPQFDGIGDYAPVLSTDGRRLAYVGVRGEKRLVVVDGREEATSDGVAGGSLRFSPDDQHVAFGAVRGLRQFVVRDGKEEETGEELKLMFFSPDSQHLAYAVVRNGRTRLVLDDKPGKEYDGLADKWACFSPDSKHLAYGAARDNRLVVVVDGQEVGVYEGNLGTLAFEGPNILSGVVTRLDEKFNFEVVRLEIQVTSK